MVNGWMNGELESRSRRSSYGLIKPPTQQLEDMRKTTKKSVRIAHDLRFEMGIS
jgi:hypothetical protein